MTNHRPQYRASITRVEWFATSSPAQFAACLVVMWVTFCFTMTVLTKQLVIGAILGTVMGLGFSAWALAYRSDKRKPFTPIPPDPVADPRSMTPRINGVSLHDIQPPPSQPVGSSDAEVVRGIERDILRERGK